MNGLNLTFIFHERRIYALLYAIFSNTKLYSLGLTCTDLTMFIYLSYLAFHGFFPHGLPPRYQTLKRFVAGLRCFYDFNKFHHRNRVEEMDSTEPIYILHNRLVLN